MHGKHHKQSRPLQVGHYHCFSAGFTHLQAQICLQGHSSATYSVWLIGNDNCYILHFQQRGNLVSASVNTYCISRVLCALHQQLLKRPLHVVAMNLRCILTFTVIVINSKKKWSISQNCKMLMRNVNWYLKEPGCFINEKND